MTNFDPKIYCKQNLSEEDREEFEFWNNFFIEAIDAESIFLGDTFSGTIDRIRKEIVDDFCETLKVALGARMQELLVLKIENYDRDVKPVDDPETFYYGD
jgi:hypothetical protein